MTEDEVLRFLRSHQPLADDVDLKESDSVAFSEVVSFLSKNRVDDAVPLLLRVFGEGDGFGVYQLVEDAAVRQSREVVVGELKRMLSSSEGNLFWLLQIATAVPDSSLRDEVVRLASHEDADVRSMAIPALEAIGDSAAFDALRQRMELETDPFVREVLAGAVREQG